MLKTGVRIYKGSSFCMAKIYETREDFERDKLAEQAGALRLKAERQSGNGLAWLVASSIPAIFSKRAWVDFAAAALSIVGITQLVKAWRSGSKAHDLELERERLGPEVIRLPADMLGSAPAHSVGEECKPCRQQQALKPRSLMDFAHKNTEPTPPER